MGELNLFLNQSFELKAGNLAYTCVRIKVADLTQFENDLLQASQQAPRLFRNAAFIAEFLFEELITAVKLKRIRKTIEGVGAGLVGIKSESQAQITECQKAGIAIIHDNKSSVGSAASQKASKPDGERGLMIQGRIRSGTQIYAKDKDLVVCGDVSHGSEIIASGNIFIYGALYGKAIAGVDGNKQAQIFTSQFCPELVSIAGIYILSEDIASEYQQKSVQVRMVNEKITLNTFMQSQAAKHYL